MSRAIVRNLNRKWQLFAISVAFLGIGASAALPAATVSAAAYSCGTYSSGAYSSSSSCAGTSTGGGGTTGGNGVGAPNTGFAKLMEPANLAAIIGSLALIVVGIAVMLRSRSRKRHDVSFTSRD